MPEPEQKPSDAMSKIPHFGGTVFDWQNGVPVAYESKIAFNKQKAQDIFYAAAALPYRGVWDEEMQEYVIDDPRFIGLTCQEVVTMKALENALRGDRQAIVDWMDRMIGRPKQAVESLTVSATYTDYLNMLEKEMMGDDDNTIDITPEEEVMDE